MAMRWFNRTEILAVLFLTGAGCHSSGSATPEGAAGAGGHAALDGAIDQMSSGGGSGGGKGTQDGAQDAEAGSGLGGCLGVCLETFLAACSEIGQSCITATTSSGEINNCYANGVKQAEVQSNGTTTVVVQTIDGQTCYESDLTGTTETIKDLDEKMIAQVTHNSQTQLTIDCYGVDGSVATTHADLTTPACAAYYASTTQTCTAGACTF